MKTKLTNFFCLMFFVFAMALMAGEKVSITGYVRSLDVDDEGNVTSVYIEAGDDIYYVAAIGKGKELTNHVDEKVAVTGTASKDEDDDTVITVTAYQLLEEEEE